MPTYREMMEILDPDGTLPPGDRVCGFEPEFSELPGAERREIERWERMSDEERLKEILDDPDVQVVMEAVEGMEPVR